MDKKEIYQQIFRIAGRLPENSCNSLIDLQSKKNVKTEKPKKNPLFLKG